MRLGFPNGESVDRIVASGELRIGRASDNDIVLDGPGVLPHHAALTVDTRGMILWLLSADAGAHVNARPVRERAVLRLGDSVTLGEVRFVLKPDSDAQVQVSGQLPELDRDQQAQQARAPARAVLRGMSGSFGGQVLPVRDRIVIGSGEACSVRLDEEGVPAEAWAIEGDGRQLLLRGLDPAARAELNGVEVRDAALHPGDQIALGHSRFLIEAPGLMQRGGVGMASRDATNITQTMRAVRAEDSGSVELSQPTSSLNVWILIASAVIIAGIIAGLLIFEF